MNETVLMRTGMETLIERLGNVEAERFISIILRNADLALVVKRAVVTTVVQIDSHRASIPLFPSNRQTQTEKARLFGPARLLFLLRFFRLLLRFRSDGHHALVGGRSP
jgi:hypothetical protein